MEGKRPEGDPSPDLLEAVVTPLPVAGWAWEFLKRNLAYRQEHAQSRISDVTYKTSNNLTVIDARSEDRADKWGLCYVESPTASYDTGAILWHPRVDRTVLPVSAIPANQSDEDAINFRSMQAEVLVVEGTDEQHVLLRQGQHTIQLQIKSGTVLNGPVRLMFPVEGVDASEQKLNSLKRFFSLLRTGTLPPAASIGQRRTGQWLMALRVAPLIQAGYGQLAAARLLFPNEYTETWTVTNEWLKAYMRRGRALGLYLIGGGYLKMLSPENTDHVVGQPKPRPPKITGDAD